MSGTFKNGYEIYNRILWDDRFDITDFSVVIKDRYQDDKEVPLKIFDANEIPWHRVVQFKQNDIIVWDRGEKLDLISQKGNNGTRDSSSS